MMLWISLLSIITIKQLDRFKPMWNFKDACELSALVLIAGAVFSLDQSLPVVLQPVLCGLFWLHEQQPTSPPPEPLILPFKMGGK